MWRVITAVTLTGLSWCAVSAEADCQLVVADTVAEVRAGFAGDWTDQLERLVRSSAGAACVKVRSERYDSDQAAGKGASSGDPADANDDGDSLTFRPLSGSPSKKPYQRARSTDSN